MSEAVLDHRSAILRLGKRLEYFAIAWNRLEGPVAIVTGAIAGSISLIGIGDSFIEVTSGAALLGRMSAENHENGESASFCEGQVLWNLAATASGFHYSFGESA